MSRHQIGKILLLLTLLGLSQARPEPRGGKRAFGAGLLGGALAGAVVGHAVAKAQSAPAPAAAASPAAAAEAAAVHHHHYHGAAPATPDPNHLTVIETGPLQANGCYQQIIKEPMASNPKMYTETVHLVCPTLQQANQPPPFVPPSVQMVPVMPQPAAVVPPAAAPAQALPAFVSQPVAIPDSSLLQVSSSSNSSHTHFVGTNVLPPAPDTPMVPPVPATHYVVPVQPQPQPAAAAQPGHVIVMSKKTMFYDKKSAASTFSLPKAALALILVFYSFKAFM